MENGGIICTLQLHLGILFHARVPITNIDCPDINIFIGEEVWDIVLPFNSYGHLLNALYIHKAIIHTITKVDDQQRYSGED